MAMTTIQLIEAGKHISREAFRNAERSGELAPHTFVENPTNAVCQDCDLVIQFGRVPDVKQALAADANDASLEELETAERILESNQEKTIYCADCFANITNKVNHECKQQRDANRRAQIKAKAERS